MIVIEAHAPGIALLVYHAWIEHTHPTAPAQQYNSTIIIQQYDSIQVHSGFVPKAYGMRTVLPVEGDRVLLIFTLLIFVREASLTPGE